MLVITSFIKKTSSYLPQFPSKIRVGRNLKYPNLILQKMSLSTSPPLRIGEANHKELNIPVPWGTIAGKEWGDPKGHPWIVLHGWLDNCGSLDTLAPIFPRGHRLLCLDIPGHGYSSHFPPGFTYHYAEGLQFIRRVSEHFNLSHFSLMGHSMGGGMCSLFAATHPEMVCSLILLDAVKPLARTNEELIKRTRRSLDDLMGIEKKLSAKKEPVYTKEIAKTRLLEAMQFHGENAVTDKSADCLLARGTRPSECGTGLVFTRDLRHRITSLYGWNPDTLKTFARGVQCPFLIVKASQTPGYERQGMNDDILEIYADNPDFQVVTVPGTHHVHLNDPEQVMAQIEPFLSKYENSIREKVM